MNDIVEFSPKQIGSFADGAADFKKVQPKTNSGGGLDYLKLRPSDGIWCYGKEGIEVEEDAEIKVLADTTTQGFVAWKAKRVIGEKMAVIGQTPVDPSTLNPVECPKGWEEQVGYGMVIISGEDAGAHVMWKSNTTGGKDAFNALFDAMMARAAAGKAFNPVITLDVDDYIHSEHGKIYKPIFTVLRWEGEDDVAQIDDEVEEAEIVKAEVIEDEKPKTKRRRRAS